MNNRRLESDDNCQFRLAGSQISLRESFGAAPFTAGRAGLTGSIGPDAWMLGPGRITRLPAGLASRWLRSLHPLCRPYRSGSERPSFLRPRQERSINDGYHRTAFGRWPLAALPGGLDFGLDRKPGMPGSAALWPSRRWRNMPDRLRLSATAWTGDLVIIVVAWRLQFSGQ